MNSRPAQAAIKRIQIPSHISDNLKWPFRPYQLQALQNHLYCEENWEMLEIEQEKFVYNMATGSGKTLIMAGLILHYYKKGYRNFLFFVHRTTILEKTRINFLRKQEEKYLFKEKIVIDGREVIINEINHFTDSHPDHINIHFTTMNQIHRNMQEDTEGRLTKSDFIDHEVVFLGDEYHHYHREIWGGVMEDLIDQNLKNVYLGFTATLNHVAKETVEKDKSRIVMKYDLSMFRREGFSKEPLMCLTQADKQGRMIQSLIVNLYRSLVAYHASPRIELKPVILFKSNRIVDSENSYEEFRSLIDGLSGQHIRPIREDSGKPNVLVRAFEFLNKKGLDDNQIATDISENFKKAGGGYNVLSLDKTGDAEYSAEVQELLNTLEKGSNPIRAIFTVDKLNEGWDVQNLFDIVRLYEGQNTGGTNKAVGKTTNQEVQLLGRGARYWPFKFEDAAEDKRKFDSRLDHDLRILEELHFHAKKEHRYLAELRRGMREIGLEFDSKEEVHVKMKKRFVDSDFYKSGKVVINERIQCSHRHVIPFDQLSVQDRAISCNLSSSTGIDVMIFESDDLDAAGEQDAQVEKIVALSEFPKNVLRFSLSQDEFFHFSNIAGLYPDISSSSDFITNYLGSLEIVFEGDANSIENLKNSDYLQASRKLLGVIKAEIKEKMADYESSGWIPKDIKDEFEKTVSFKLDSESPRYGGQPWLNQKKWYVQNQNHGTDQERAFIKSFSSQFDWRYHYKFEEVHILRNEKELAIYNELGRGFQPDFLLFCKERNSNLVRQVFIEPKGDHLKEHDSWKNDFLEEIQAEGSRISTESGEILVCAATFYNSKSEKQFREELANILELPSGKEARPAKLREVLGDSDRFPDGDNRKKSELIDDLNSEAKLNEDEQATWDESTDTDKSNEEEQEEGQTNEINWGDFTVKELKKFLITANLPVSGNKGALITRITDAESPTEPNWAEMDGQEIKRYLAVFPIRRSDFNTFLEILN
uniref:Type III site-specific deoxyribonuclease n=1 Tax=uncultured marine group II/III euryarchaeote KM3_16_D12 TaxID=1457926 RepID=A0A075GPI8_9EURY|nr:Type III site-specific deoxyribonuclease [uncultured marine group II/III euryarchaeote KM3_16_D12]